MTGVPLIGPQEFDLVDREGKDYAHYAKQVLADIFETLDAEGLTEAEASYRATSTKVKAPRVPFRLAGKPERIR